MILPKLQYTLQVMFITEKRPGSLVEFFQRPALNSSIQAAQQQTINAEAATAPDASARPDGCGAGRAGLDSLAAGPAPTVQGPAARLAQAVVGRMAAVLHALQQRAGMARLHTGFVGRMAQTAVGLVLALAASATGEQGRLWCTALLRHKSSALQVSPLVSMRQGDHLLPASLLAIDHCRQAACLHIVPEMLLN